jgi:hypothetical protein
MWLASRDKAPLITQYVAERMCPMADKMIKKLQAEEPVDLRWTRSFNAASILSFEGDEQSRTNKILCWTRAENHKKFIEKPWVWMSVDKLPCSISWRGYNPPKAFI